jgi:hypothetical protein
MKPFFVMFCQPLPNISESTDCRITTNEHSSCCMFLLSFPRICMHPLPFLIILFLFSCRFLRLSNPNFFSALTVVKRYHFRTVSPRFTLLNLSRVNTCRFCLSVCVVVIAFLPRHRIHQQTIDCRHFHVLRKAPHGGSVREL